MIRNHRLLLLGLLFATFTTTAAAPVDELQRLFEDPPDDARIMMRWWWFGPAVTKPELEREMRLMKDGGIGGFEVQPVYPLVLDDERTGIKTLPFLSDSYLDALRFTSDKARELGLRFDLTLGSGWPFGGPTVSIDHSAGRLRYEHTRVDGTTRFAKVPPLSAGERLLGIFVADVEEDKIDATSVREIPLGDSGTIDLTAIYQSAGGPAHSKELMFFISSRTGMQVKRPAVGAEGFVLDHMNRAATDDYLRSVGDRLFQAFGSNPPYSIFCDSLEVYNSDWTADFLEQFRARRGYDLKPRLPMLVNDSGAETRRLRRDWGRTLYELLNERFLAPYKNGPNETERVFAFRTTAFQRRQSRAITMQTSLTARARSGKSLELLVGPLQRVIYTIGPSPHPRPGPGCIHRRFERRRSM